MNWTILAKSARSVKRQASAPRVRCRPRLEILEDRTVLSVVDFLEVQSQSPLTLSGTIAGMPLQQQGANALTTTYFGDFRADVDEASGVIKFIGSGNDYCAANTGNWAPLADGGSGTATAIYGLQANLSGMTFLAAIRDFHLRADNFGSGLTLYQNGDGSFGFSSTETITINAGSGTYSHPTLGHGPVNLSGLNAPDQADDGTLVDNGSSLRLTVPIDMTVNTTLAGQSATLRIQGTIVGTATLPVVHLGSGSNPNNYATAVVATQGPVHITDPAATVTDASSGAHLTSLTATLTNRPDGAQEFLSANVSGTGLTASYNAATGVETISGSATPAVYQNVLRTLTYEDDASTPDTHDRIINVTVSDGTNSSMVRTSTVTVYAPAQSFAVTDFPASVTAGTAGSITVTAQDGNGNPAPGYIGTVHFTSSDSQATASNGLPADYTFTAADHGVHTFTNVVLKTAGPQSITATDAANSSITGAETNIAVLAAAPDHLLFTNPSTVTAGVPFTVGVTVQDAFNNTVVGYSGTIHFTSSLGVSADRTYTPADMGERDFTLTLYRVQTLSLTGTDTGSSAAGSTSISVVAAPAASFLVLANSSAASGSPFDLTVVAVDRWGNIDTNYTGTVSFTTTDTATGVMVPVSYTFQSGDAGMVTFTNGATLLTPGVQTIFVADTTGMLRGSVDVTIV